MTKCSFLSEPVYNPRDQSKLRSSMVLQTLLLSSSSETSARAWSQQRQCEAWQQALARRLISSAGIRGLLPDWWLSERQPDELPCSDMTESHKAIIPGIKGSCGAWSPSARCRGTQRWSALGFMKKFEYLQERQVNPRTRHAYAGTLNSQVKSTRPFSSSNPLDWDIETRIKIFDNTMLFYNPAGCVN